MDLKHTALLLIDIQIGIGNSEYWGLSRSNPQFESNVTALLQKFRKIRDESEEKPLIVHVFHKSENPQSPLYPTSPGVAFEEFAKPQGLHEIVISKSAHSAFIGTSLEDTLRANEIRRLYVVGLVTDHCVSTSVRMAYDLKVTDWVDESGVRQTGGVYLIEDATAAYSKGNFDAELVHAVHAESLKNEFATVIKTKDLLQQLGYQD